MQASRLEAILCIAVCKCFLPEMSVLTEDHITFENIISIKVVPVVESPTATVFFKDLLLDPIHVRG